MRRTLRDVRERRSARRERAVEEFKSEVAVAAALAALPGLVSTAGAPSPARPAVLLLQR